MNYNVSNKQEFELSIGELKEKPKMVVEEKEYQDNKIIYHLDINEEANIIKV